MNPIENEFNRRDFLRGGSIATLMTMLGGVELRGEAEDAASQKEGEGRRVKVAVIGLGGWGREILSTFAYLRIDQDHPEKPPRLVDVVAICDNYPAYLNRAAKLAPDAAKVADYKAILANPEIQAVVVATPTHLHKEITIAALKAGKHVYCEAPMAHTIADAKEIALAAKAAKKSVFQVGLQFRADGHRYYMVKNFIRPGAIGQPVMARAQWHKKTTWRSASPSPEREKALNWRLDKSISLGLIGEAGIHPIDQFAWFTNTLPTAVTGFGSIQLHKDGRDVADTVQAVVEFPGDVKMIYDATLASSFDSEYEVIYGVFASILARDHKAWLFQETDSPLLGWEVYSKREQFHDGTGIVIAAGASKSVQAKPAAGGQAPAGSAQPVANTPPPPPVNGALSDSLERFLRNCDDFASGLAGAIDAFGADDADALEAQLVKVREKLRPTGGFVEGYRSVVTAIKANEAVMGGKRVEIPADLYEF